MSIFGIILLTTSITVSRVPASSDNTEKALIAIGKASYKQFGVDKKVKKLEKEYVPKEIRKHGKWIAIGIKLVNEKKISYEWTF